MVNAAIQREMAKDNEEQNKKARFEGSARAQEWLDSIGGPSRNTKRKVSLQVKSAQNEASKMRGKDDIKYYYWEGYYTTLQSRLANPSIWRK